MPTVVLKFSQKISAFSRPSHPSLPPERSLRSAHRLSESSSYTSDIPYAAESKGEAPLVERESPENRPKGSLVVSFFSSPGAAILFFLRKEKEKNGGANVLLLEKQKENAVRAPFSERGEKNGSTIFPLFQKAKNCGNPIFYEISTTLQLPCAPNTRHCPFPSSANTAFRSAAQSAGSVSTAVIKIGAYRLYSACCAVIPWILT